MPDYYNWVPTGKDADSMKKIAISVGTLRALGGAAGAAGGGLMGWATTKDPDKKVINAIKGSAIGAGVGIAGLPMATSAGRLANKQFLQRQLHSLTGYLPGKGLFGRGVTGAEKAELLKGIGWHVPEAVPTAKGFTPTESAVQKHIQERLSKGWFKDQRRAFYDSAVGRALARHRLRTQIAQRKLVESGGTSIPGLVKNLVVGGDVSRGDLLKSLVLSGGAAGVALPAAFVAPSAYESYKKRDIRPLATSIAENAGYTLTGGLALAPQLVASEALARGVRKLRGNE